MKKAQEEQTKNIAKEMAEKGGDVVSEREIPYEEPKQEKPKRKKILGLF